MATHPFRVSETRMPRLRFFQSDDSNTVISARMTWTEIFLTTSITYHTPKIFRGDGDGLNWREINLRQIGFVTPFGERKNYSISEYRALFEDRPNKASHIPRHPLTIGDFRHIQPMVKDHRVPESWLQFKHILFPGAVIAWPRGITTLFGLFGLSQDPVRRVFIPCMYRNPTKLRDAVCAYWRQ